ncbi:MAG: hypothetical protein M9944_13575 [Rhizobiaceae bacterium]|nr:hypothetical protein [Rhizobiaceae bacterium]
MGQILEWSAGYGEPRDAAAIIDRIQHVAVVADYDLFTSLRPNIEGRVCAIPPTKVKRVDLGIDLSFGTPALLRVIKRRDRDLYQM